MGRLVRWHRIAALIAIASASCALASAVVACIIADPPPDLPRAPRHHPLIVHGAVVPPATKVLSTFPGKFVVPVELIDTETSFLFNVFVDYDALDPGRASPVLSDRRTPTPGTVDGGVALVDFTIDAPDPASCHVIELVVALGFDNKSAHTPDQFGGDNVVWFYNPSGDPGGCPVYDAGGIDGAAPDVQPDRIFVPPDDGGSQ